MPALDSLKTLHSLIANGETYHYYSLPEAARTLDDLDKLPISLKVPLEDLLCWEDDSTVTDSDLKILTGWLRERRSDRKVQCRSARVLMQDFTRVPTVVDLTAMRAVMAKVGGDPQKINPLSPVDLVIDHSVMIDKFASESAFEQNVEIEMQRSGEYCAFLRWGQNTFGNFNVVSPGTGIYHQVNLECLGHTVWTKEKDGRTYAFPDTLAGTDSHTTMVSGLGVLDWGVSGIKAEVATFGQPVSMLIPEVIGFKLTGKLREDITTTDLMLAVTRMLRKKGVIGKFAELYGDGLVDLPLVDRAIIASMTPGYGTTCSFFPVDEVTLGYLRLSGCPESTIKLVEAYSKEQGLWREKGHEPVFTSTLHLDMDEVEASLAGPKRPRDHMALQNVASAFNEFLGLQLHPSSTEEGHLLGEGGGGTVVGANAAFGEIGCQYDDQTHRLKNDAVVITTITSCTNTSNSSVMMAAGLLVKKAVKKDPQRKLWVKSSLAPGSRVVTGYFKTVGLTRYLDGLGFNLVGYGCTTCIGNSGLLLEPIRKAIQQTGLTVVSAPSGNRNFEGRVHPLVKTNWLASPPLMVAYALAGSVRINLSKEPLGTGRDGQPVYLKDIWPSQKEITEATQKVDIEMFYKECAEVFADDEKWQAIQVPQSNTYEWQTDSTYIQHSPFSEHIAGASPTIADIEQARVLAVLGGSVTTGHISPADNIKADSPAGRYLREYGVEPKDFNSYGSRRGNHEVMMRGTFANVHIRNEMLGGEEGGNTLYVPSGEKLAIYDTAIRYQQNGTPLVIVADKGCGTSSSHDWAAEGTNLLGVKAVIAESSERIHRPNLVGIGVLPLQSENSQDRKSLRLTGKEVLNIRDFDGELRPHMPLNVEVTREDGSQDNSKILCRTGTLSEVEYFKAGGILHYMLRSML